MLLITGDITQTKVLLTIIAGLLALYFAVVKFRKIDWRQFLIIVGIVLLGFPLGIYLFDMVDVDLLKKALGIFIVLTASVQLHKLFVARKED